LSVPTGDGGSITRRYSIRRLDPDTEVVDLDIVRHGDGPGARWVAAVAPGDQVEGVGPRGKVTVVPDADWHLFAGDDSAVAAISAMVEGLAAPQQAVVFLEVDGPEDRQPLTPGPGVEPTVTWLYRGDGAPGTGTQLIDAVASAPLPGGRGHAYLAGEHHQVAALRRALLERGLDAGQISPKPYWRADQANQGHGEPGRD